MNRGSKDRSMVIPTTVTYDVDFDGREIWEYTYPAYFVRYRDGKVLDFTPQAGAAEETATVQVTRAFTPRSRTAADIQAILVNFLSDTSYGSSAGRSVIDQATNTLIVTHYPQNMTTIEEYIRLLDEQTAYQVMIEARFVELNRDATRRLGISWNAQGQNAQGNQPFVTVNQSGNVSNPGGAQGAQQGVGGIGGISFGVLDANSFRFGHISLQDIDIVIQALEEQNLAKVLSAPRLLTAEAIAKMGPDAIVFALANPEPEVMPEDAAPYARIVATGRSDYANQINNVLCFPGMFRGALDCRAKGINDEMNLAAAQAIADVVSKRELHEDYIIPSVFDKRVAKNVAKAVVHAAHATGMARRRRKASYEQ